jgi:hypothetical protein
MIGLTLLFVVTPLLSAYLAHRGGVGLFRALTWGALALPVCMGMWMLAMAGVGIAAALLSDTPRAEAVHQYGGWAAILAALIYWHAVALIARNKL